MKHRLLTLLLVTSFLLVTVSGCARQSTPAPELDTEIEEAEEFENNRKLAFDNEEIVVSYADTEAEFLKVIKASETFRGYSLYDAEELTVETLESRNGAVIIERCIGIVTDKTSGDGRLLNFEDGSYYISYSGMDDIRDGTVVLSYMIYNPENNYFDDIMERYDFVISREYED